MKASVQPIIMRITCPNCAAEYEVEAAMIPDAGRDVQCSACGHTWMQFSDGRAEEIAPSGTAVAPYDAASDEANDGASDGAEAWGGEESAPDADLPTTGPAAADGDGDGDGTATSGRRQLDDDTRRILKEEAEREAAARRARRREAEAPLETQGDLGLRDTPAQRVDTPDPSRDDRAVAQDDGESRDAPHDPWRPEDTFETAADPAPDRDTARRSRGYNLPDIEEINSSLAARPNDAGETTGPDDTPAEPAQDTAFRSGFTLMLAVALILIALYLLAPRIADAVPALEPAMRAYVEAANALRTTVNAALQSAADAIGGAVDPSDP